MRPISRCKPRWPIHTHQSTALWRRCAIAWPHGGRVQSGRSYDRHSHSASVDDEPDVREVVDVSLDVTTRNLRHTPAHRARTLITAAEWSPSIILLDVMMPLMDEARQRLPTFARTSRRTAHIPVVFLTTHVCGLTRSSNTPRSAPSRREPVCKPFDPMTLAASVRSYLPLSERSTMPRDANNQLHPAFKLSRLKSPPGSTDNRFWRGHLAHSEEQRSGSS